MVSCYYFLYNVYNLNINTVKSTPKIEQSQRQATVRYIQLLVYII